jgi:long-chain acyl-CoA synthetase
MKTIIELFETSVEKFPNNPLLWEKTNGQYMPSTYKEIQGQVYLLGAGLMSLGISKGDRVGLLAEGRNAWLISELAILYCGAINVPLSVKLENSELKFRLEHSGSRMVIVSKGHSAKVEDIRNDVSCLEKVIYIDEKDNASENDLLFKDIMKRGEKYLKDEKHKTDFESIWKSILPDDIANISYTSGTTADPKGIMLSQLNYATNVKQANTLLEIHQEYKTLAVLPWDHSFAHTCCLYIFMSKGASIGSIQVGSTPMETLRNVPINIKEFKPDILMSVPALSKNFRKNIEKGIQSKGATIEKLFKFGLKVAYAYNAEGWNRGKGLRMLLKPLYALFDKIIFSKISEGFGGKLKFFIGGGALLDIELQRFFAAIGIPICQGYGLSEASPAISSNTPLAVMFGSSGRLVKYMDLKIRDAKGNELPPGEKGEITIYGDNVMKGYWKNPKATEETLRNGWLHTGDMGYMNEKGFLYVLGRFKSLLIGNDGEKYSPEGIEEAIVDQSEFIDQAMLYNNQNPFTTGMFVPNITALNRVLEKMNIEIGSEEGNSKSIEIIKSEIDAYFKGGKHEGQFPERWLPATVAILPEAFTEQNHLLNSTMKMVRGKIVKYFKKELDFLYTPKAKNIINEMNLEAIWNWNK